MDRTTCFSRVNQMFVIWRMNAFLGPTEQITCETDDWHYSIHHLESDRVK